MRIAGRFKGDVNVQGNVTIEQGAHVNGQVNAATVMVSGEVEGNITATARVELLETGVINGDVKAAIAHRRRGLAHARQCRLRLGRPGPGAQVSAGSA